MSRTSDALAAQAQVIVQLADIVINLIQQNQVSEQQKQAALAQAKELVEADDTQAETVDGLTSKLQELINAAAAAAPSPEPTPTEPTTPIE